MAPDASSMSILLQQLVSYATNALLVAAISHTLELATVVVAILQLTSS